MVPVEERPLRAAYTAERIWALAPVVDFDTYTPFPNLPCHV
jgi:hypothetical protein